MLTVIIGIIAFVAIFPAITEGEWTAVWVVAAILVCLMFMSGEERKTVKALRNARDYLAKGEFNKK